MKKPRITSTLPQFTEQVQAKGARGMVEALVCGAAEASVFTPIDTSALIGSQYKKIDADSTKVTGRVGYTVVYAEPVHNPENVQKFRRANARKEFLKLGFEQAEPKIRAIIKGSIRT